MREARFEDLDAKYESWTPMSFVGRNKHGIRLVLCRCDCGKLKEVRLDHLRTRSSRNCGCSRVGNLIGCKYAMLTVLKMVGMDSHGQIVLCKCDCGGSKLVRADLLKNGNNKSCGCLISEANEEIARWLASKGFLFQREYRDDRCRHTLPLPFDFAVWCNSGPSLIEFQGYHHYHTSGNRNVKRLEDTMRNDLIKREFCESHGVPLLIIPYWQRRDMFGTIEEFFNSKELGARGRIR